MAHPGGRPLFFNPEDGGVEEMQKMLYKFFDKSKVNKVNQNINTQNFHI